MKILNIFSKLSLFGALFLTACADEDKMEGLLPEAKDGITITAICHDMLPQVLMTRADMTNTPKTAKEKQINTLHLFFFDDQGKFLTPTDPDIFSADYRLEVNDPESNGEKQAALTISNNTFDNQKDLKNVQVYAVANVYGNKFKTPWTMSDGDIVHGHKTDPNEVIEIKTLDDLKNWYYRPTPRADNSQLPTPGMPMVGLTTEVDLSPSSKNKTIQINMQALMARVDISVQLNANQTNNDGTLPKLQIKQYGVRNMPYCVPFSALNPGEKTEIPEEGSDKDPNPHIRREIVMPYDGAVLYDGQKAATFTYYTYENVQYPTELPHYPEGVDDKDPSVTQRWKRTIADKNASALVLKGDYVTHQGLQYTAEFNVYMGSNPVDNFEVRRNCCYKNNITICGLDYVQNNPEMYNFDGRVNVVTDNPLYLAIVNERKVDAHASVLPMDVWLLLRESGSVGGDRPTVTHQSTVTVSIANPEETRWIRMEKIPRIDMEKTGFQAGTGARSYFTTDLVTKELAANTTITIDGDKDDSRTRIYFYIDENIPTSSNADVPDRKAYINVHYENSLGDKRDRVLEIEQRGMLRVSDPHPGGYDSRENVYIEYYEEYLSHNDPLDQHLMPGMYYTGLPWGQNVQYSTMVPHYDATDIYTDDKSLEMTRKVLNSGSSMSNIKLYLENAPESAFHYCYGKNKRDKYGNVPDEAPGHWYMPGIRELESALAQYYLTFPDFQGNFYWSASAAKNSKVSTSYEQTDRARATKVTDKTTKPIKYAESGSKNDAHNYTGKNGNGGRALRSEALRIRAFYKYYGKNN